MSWGLLFLAATVFLFLKNLVFAQPDPELTINEIMYDAPGTDSEQEWVEIKNLSTQEINLTGFKINDGTNHLLNEPPKNSGQGSFVLPANGFLIIADNAERFLAEHPGVNCSVIDSSLSLKNSAGEVKLLDNEGQEVSTVSYTSSQGGAGDGQTLERKITPDNTIFWQASQETGGSPGQENSPYAEPEQTQEPAEKNESPAPDTNEHEEEETESPPDSSVQAEAGPDIIALVGQEVSFDASASRGNLKYFFWNFGDGQTSTGQPKTTHVFLFPGTYLVGLTVGDGQKENTDFCEIKIIANDFIISEFLPWAQEEDATNEWVELYNRSANTSFLDGWSLDDGERGSRPFVFPKNTAVKGKSYLVVSRQTSKIALNNNEDSVRLFLPGDELAQEIKYTQAQKGVSAAVYGDNNFYWSQTPTPGRQNFPEVVAAENVSQVETTLRLVKKKSTPNLLLNLIPTAQAIIVKKESFSENIWQQASAILQEKDSSSATEKNLFRQTAQQTTTLSSYPLGTKIIKRWPFHLLALFISLVLSLFIFGWWLVRLVKK